MNETTASQESINRDERRVSEVADRRVHALYSVGSKRDRRSVPWSGRRVADSGEAPERIWMPRKDAPYVPNAAFYVAHDNPDDIEYVRVTHTPASKSTLEIDGIAYKVAQGVVEAFEGLLDSLEEYKRRYGKLATSTDEHAFVPNRQCSGLTCEICDNTQAWHDKRDASLRWRRSVMPDYDKKLEEWLS